VNKRIRKKKAKQIVSLRDRKLQKVPLVRKWLAELNSLMVESIRKNNERWWLLYCTMPPYPTDRPITVQDILDREAHMRGETVVKRPAT
jgi:hypothetical protein